MRLTESSREGLSQNFISARVPNLKVAPSNRRPTSVFRKRKTAYKPSPRRQDLSDQYQPDSFKCHID